jgi:hypothetical protein
MGELCFGLVSIVIYADHGLVVTSSFVNLTGPVEKVMGSFKQLLFANKKKQKNFYNPGRGVWHRRCQTQPEEKDFLCWDMSWGSGVATTPEPGSKKFFGAFLQKSTACLRLSPC